MKRSGRLLAAGLASILAAGISTGVTAAADSGVQAQELMNVATAGQVTARWLREPDAYALQVVVERSKPRPRTIRPASTEQAERSGYFIGNTVANLRDLDPAFTCNRSLTLVDGRRPNGAGRVPPILPYDPKARQPRVEVWLLKADGTQIPSADYRCTSHPATTEVRYQFQAADGGQAVAAAIRIDDGFYIEKLQPLQPMQSVQ